MMFVVNPPRLSELRRFIPSFTQAKRGVDIAIIDDEPFSRLEQLRTHGFQVSELGGDIRSVDQIKAYPIVICDIKGVGLAFGSKLEGAHVIGEIRKAHPDKYLIVFSGGTFDARYNECLSMADASITKDQGIDYWVAALERAVKEVTDPTMRWLRFRSRLAEQGVDAVDIFTMESLYIKAVRKKDPSEFRVDKDSYAISDEVKGLLTKFAATAVVEVIEHFTGAN